VLDILRWVLGLPVLAILLYVPGAIVLNSLGARHSGRHLFAGVEEWLFTAVLIGFLVTGLMGFILAEIGFFRLWLLVPLVLAFSLAVALTLGQTGLAFAPLVRLLRVPSAYPQRVAERRLARLQRLALLGLILLAAILFSRPSEMLRGALDAGAYINAGVALSNSGSILQTDILMRQLDNDKGEVRELMQGLNPDRYTLDTLRMPAFYVLDKKAALVLPQHYSLYPVWIGLMNSVFGLWGALYATPLLAVLGVLAVYFFARRALNQGAALVTALLLILCPVTIWFARYPVSEVITGLLVFSGSFAFMRMVQLASDRPPPAELSDTAPEGLAGEDARVPWSILWGIVAGVSLGQIALARPDFIFYLAPLPVYLIYWRVSRGWHRAYTAFASALAVMLAIYVAHFAFYSFAYTLDLYHNVIQDVRRRWGLVLLVLYAGALIFLLLDRLYPRLRPIWTRLEISAGRYRWAWAGLIILLLALYAIYNYLYAPWQPNVRVDSAGRPILQSVVTTWESYIGAPVDEGARYNLLRVGWYLSPLGMALGILGLLRWVWDRLSAATGLFFASLVIVGFIFIQETFTEAHYIYTMRRYVPIILPALIMGIAWACNFLWSRVRPRPLGYAAAGVVVLALSMFFIYTSRAIVPHIEERGAVAQLTQLADRLKQDPAEKAVVLFSNERDEPFLVATPLQYIFGIESFVLNRGYPSINNQVIDGIVKRWQSQGYTVYIMMGANGGKMHLPDYDLQEEGYWEYRVPEFEQLRNQKPTNVSEAFLPWGIYRLVPHATTSGENFAQDIGNMDYPSLVAGWHKEERDSPTSEYWRWTGEDAILRVPWPTAADGKTYEGGAVRLRLRPETPVEDQPPLRTEPLTMTVSLDNTPLDTGGGQVGTVSVAPGSDWTDYTVTLPAGIAKTNTDPEHALLHLRAPTWSGRGAGISGDARVLGVQVDGVEVNR
jgi:hypothetical protein